MALLRFGLDSDFCSGPWEAGEESSRCLIPHPQAHAQSRAPHSKQRGPHHCKLAGTKLYGRCQRQQRLLALSRLWPACLSVGSASLPELAAFAFIHASEQSIWLLGKGLLSPQKRSPLDTCDGREGGEGPTPPSVAKREPEVQTNASNSGREEPDAAWQSVIRLLQFRLPEFLYHNASRLRILPARASALRL